MQPASSTGAPRRRAIAAALILLALAVLGWAALAPVARASRDALYEIPPGTYAHRMAGEKVDIFPQTIRLNLNDVLVLRNADSVPHIFGPTLLMPGQSFRLPFGTASTYSFECSAHPAGGLSVIVKPDPTPGWNRLAWRLRHLSGTNTL